jgi:hypothetical protein
MRKKVRDMTKRRLRKERMEKLEEARKARAAARALDVLVAQKHWRPQ